MRRPYAWVNRLSGREIPAPYRVRGRLFAGMTEGLPNGLIPMRRNRTGAYKGCPYRLMGGMGAHEACSEWVRRRGAY